VCCTCRACLTQSTRRIFIADSVTNETHKINKIVYARLDISGHKCGDVETKSNRCRYRNTAKYRTVKQSEQVCVQFPTSSAVLYTWHCSHLLLSAGRAVQQSTAIPAHRAHSSKFAAAECGGRTMGQTDRRTPDRYTDPAPHSRPAALKTKTLRARK